MIRQADMAPVAVVGGGVAGTAAIISLSRLGLTPAWIIDDHPVRHRSFGDWLSPGARPILRRLGAAAILDDPRHRPSHSVFSSWSSALLVERDSAVHLEGPGMVIDRPAFEAGLQHMARDACEPTTRRMRAASCSDEGWVLDLADGTSLRTHFVIDATGRSRVIGRRYGEVRVADRMVAAVARLDQQASDVQATRATVIEALPDGWLYASILADEGMSVAYFTDPDLLPVGLHRDREAWRFVIDSSTHVRRWLDETGFAIRRHPAIVPAGTSYLRQAAGTAGRGSSGWAAIGDAAACLDPLSSHGLTTALWSGARVAEAVASWIGGDSASLDGYQQAVQSGVRRFLNEQVQVYRHQSRFANRPFWFRRRTS